jgi:hypothetical protein
MLGDEGKPHRGSFAKKAMVFLDVALGFGLRQLSS